MTTFPASAVTSSLLSAALELHSANNPGSQFPVCRCGHSSMDVYRPRHLREVVRRTAHSVLVPTPVLGEPSLATVSLLTAALTRVSLEQHKTMMPMVVTSRALVCAYSPVPNIPLLDPDGLMVALESTLRQHGVESMSITEGGAVLLHCVCGHEVDEDLFESHRAAEVAKSGCVYGTPSEIYATYRSLTLIADNLPAQVLREYPREANDLYNDMARLQRHLQSLKS